MRGVLHSFILIAAGFAPGLSTDVVAQTSTDRSIQIITPGQSPAPAPTPPPGPPPVAQTPGPIAPWPASADTVNPAGLSMELLPGTEVGLGTKLSITVTSKRSGYLVLVDVDATGRLVQIYPNRLSLTATEGLDAPRNLLKPDTTKVIPDATGQDAFEFVATAPKGSGMLVAMLSDSPVLYVDLPDVASGLKDISRFVMEQTRSLRILPVEDGAPIVEPKWSFATKPYSIK